MLPLPSRAIARGPSNPSAQLGCSKILRKSPFKLNCKKIDHFQKRERDLIHNHVQKIREELLVSKAELARKAKVSPLTIDRIERGINCRLETKRKIILALGYKLSDKEKIFPED